jgi:hypothetical protein
MVREALVARRRRDAQLGVSATKTRQEDSLTHVMGNVIVIWDFQPSVVIQSPFPIPLLYVF